MPLQVSNNSKESPNSTGRRWILFSAFRKLVLTIANFFTTRRREISTSEDEALNELDALSDIINNSLKSIRKSISSQNAVFPSLDTPFTPESQQPCADPAIAEAASLIVSASAQIMAMVTPSPQHLLTLALQFHIPSALRSVNETHVVEILREAGPEGLHVDEISRKNHTDPNKLARILRLLATEHVFREVSPNVFANNRISSVLDTGKSSSELVAKPSEKFTGNPGIAATVSHVAHHAFKSSAYMTEAMIDPEFALSYESNKVGFNKAFRTDLAFFPWMELPGNEKELTLLGKAMEGSKASIWDGVIDFDWKGLPQDSVVVDVGGGIGTQSLSLIKLHPHLKVVVQDREAVIEDAKIFWKQHMPDAITNGRADLQANDFFTGQPVKKAALYFLRLVLHDWSDEYCITILKHLRASAGPQSRLLIIDNVMSYACKNTDPTFVKVSDESSELPPSPLLANNGHGSALKYFADIQMLACTNGQERTLHQYNALLEKTGWKLSKVTKTSYLEAGHQNVIAVPV